MYYYTIICVVICRWVCTCTPTRVSFQLLHLHVDIVHVDIGEAQLKFNSWMRVEIHLKLNSFACDIFNWTICIHTVVEAQTEIQLLNASYTCYTCPGSTSSQVVGRRGQKAYGLYKLPYVLN